jgi:hypothetical protein
MTIVSRSADNFIVQIAPGGVVADNKINLPFARPVLDVLFALERSDGGIVRFVVDELLHSISPRKAADKSFAMFVNAANEIVRHPDVQRSAGAAGENVDPVIYARSACAGLTRASIYLRKSLSKMMDCRVKPGNDDFCE